MPPGVPAWVRKGVRVCVCGRGALYLSRFPCARARCWAPRYLRGHCEEGVEAHVLGKQVPDQGWVGVQVEVQIPEFVVVGLLNAKHTGWGSVSGWCGVGLYGQVDRGKGKGG